MKSKPDNTDYLRGIQYVFLDRDGVINRKAREGEYISAWKDFDFLPGAQAAIAELNHHQFRVIVVTNQRGISLGLYTETELRALHGLLQQHLAAWGARIDAFYFCPHDRGECECRKPAIGLFKQAFLDFPQASPENSVMIGDSLSDMEAARALGCVGVFVRGDAGTRKPGSERAAQLAHIVTDSLPDAAMLLVARRLEQLSIAGEATSS